MGRPETKWARVAALTLLGSGLSDAKHHEDALSVQEAELSMRQRLGVSEDSMLIVQSNLPTTPRRPKMGLLDAHVRSPLYFPVVGPERRNATHTTPGLAL